jgi:hypothetical protein
MTEKKLFGENERDLKGKESQKSGDQNLFPQDTKLKVERSIKPKPSSNLLLQ